MVDICKFSAIRPNKNLASEIADFPYDIVNTKEARRIVEKKPLSFLKIDRPEVNFKNIKSNNIIVYEKAKQLIEEYINKEYFIKDSSKNLYLYELSFNDNIQYGIVCLSSAIDYLNKNIKIHEYTLAEKEVDRTNHIDITGYHTGPIFLIYKYEEEINEIIKDTLKDNNVIFDYKTEENINHKGYIINRSDDLVKAFEKVENTYIADGHHRAKSAINVYENRKKEGLEIGESDYFLSVLFASNNVNVLSYNRYVDISSINKKDFIDLIKEDFNVELLENKEYPKKKSEIIMYLDKNFYKINLKNQKNLNIIESLDVSILQKYIFSKILNIEDPRNDKRLKFVGGINDFEKLIDMSDKNGGAVFYLYPVKTQDIMEISNNNNVMPPKSTWFEPKLNSGLFLHKI